MLKRAIISGLPSAGVNVQDLRSVPIPVARYVTRMSDASGGVHVRLSPHDGRVVDIKFIDGQGLDLDKDAQRKIERIFFREDFRRVYLDEIGEIRYAPQVQERYTQGFMTTLDTEVIRQAGFYIVVDYANAPTALMLPPILTALNCSVVALNASLDETKMSISPEEFGASLEQLALICRALKTNLGVRLDVGGEKIFLVDNQGRCLDGITACACMVALALQASGGGNVAVPVNLPSIFEKLAERFGGSVIRTKCNLQALMKASKTEGVIVAGDGAGNFIFPSFDPVVDGLMAVAKLLEFLATQSTSLSEVTAALPEYHVARSRVSCPWEKKGTVMRLLNEQYKDTQAERTDGMKVHLGDEWVLVLPDPDHPVFHIYAESGSDSQAEDLAGKYARIVEGLQD